MILDRDDTKRCVILVNKNRGIVYLFVGGGPGGKNGVMSQESSNDATEGEKKGFHQLSQGILAQLLIPGTMRSVRSM